MIRRGRTQSWWPILLLAGVVGPPLGWVVHYTAFRAEQARVQASFNDLVAEKAFRLEKEILSLCNVARSVQAFFESSNEVTRSEFHSFVKGPLSRLGAIRAIEWAPCVTRNERQEHERAARADGFANYTIREPTSGGEVVRAAPRSAYYPVYYVEPHEANATAFGLDLACEATRRRALDEAALHGEPILSDPLRLVQGSGDGPGILLFQAVDDADGDGAAGFVVLAVTVPDLLCATELVCEGSGNELLLLGLDDVDGTEGAQPLFRSPGYATSDLEATRDIVMGGQVWQFRAVPTAAFLEGRRSLQPFLLGLATLFLWIVFVGFAGLGARRLQERALDRQSRTIRSVLSALTEGVVVADADGTILFANEAARAMVGRRGTFPPEEGWAQACGFFLPDTITPYPEADLPLTRALHGERVREVEVFVRNERTPRGAWLGISGSPLRSREDRFQGGVVVLRDVTERRRFQAQRIEMQLAARIQKDLYPPHAPSVPGLDLAGRVVSAEATCGDYYDFLPLIDGRWALVIGDVSGHGLGPALVMGQVRAYLRSVASSVANPEEILTRVNHLLTPDLRESLFVTLLIVCLDPASGRLAYASAGHTPAYVIGANGAVRHELLRTGIPLGIYADSAYHRSEMASLGPGETLLMMTDGVPESRSPTGDFLLEEGALNLVREVLDAPATGIVEHLETGLERFRQGNTPDDDVTMIVARRGDGLPAAAPDRRAAATPLVHTTWSPGSAGGEAG